MKKRAVCFVLAIVGAAVLFGGAFFFVPGVRTGERRESKLSTKPPINPEGNQVITAVASYDFSEMSEYSDLIVYGRVSYIHESGLLLKSGGGIDLFTDVEITPVQVLRGTAEDVVTLRLRSGQAGEYTARISSEPDLLLDGEYLLYLKRPGAGCGINGPGDYYYLVGDYQSVFCPVEVAPERIGAFSASDPGDVAFVNCTEVEQAAQKRQPYRLEEELQTAEELKTRKPMHYEARFTLSTLQSYYAEFNQECPVWESWQLEQLTETYENNLKTGFLTREEYEEALEELDEYAVEITLEEAEKITAANEEETERLRAAIQEELRQLEEERQP